MNWHAQMISASAETVGAPLFRTEFNLLKGHGAVRIATLDVTAFGIVDARVNGQPVAPALLTPGWTSYEWRLRYATFDITALLEPCNAVGLTVGNGWYRGRLGWTGASQVYGQETGASAQLSIEYEDGHLQQVITDQSWRTSAGPVLADDLYDGQTIDARALIDGWDRPGFNSQAWAGVRTLALDTSRLEPYIGPKVTPREVLPVQRTWISPGGKVLVDFGQNIVGWVRVRTQGPTGTAITIRHAEVLEHDELGVRPLRSALATDRFILSGGPDLFEPTFTFHGFRYAEIEGWPGDFDTAAIEAVIIGSELERIGTFTCSDPLLSQFHRNVVWGLRGNFVDVPADCPQRDERLGWTGDLSVFAPTAAFLFDVKDFLKSWLRDLAIEQQHHNGMVPFVVPDVLKYTDRPGGFDSQATTAIWSDAAVWVPWALWQAYGDQTVLEDQFESMTAHVRQVRSLLSPTGLWDTGFQFGDWLDPDAPIEHPELAKAHPGVVATASAYRTAGMLAQAAAVLGRTAEQTEFNDLATALRVAFNQYYVNVDAGYITSDCATVYALAISFGLLDPTIEQAAGRRLAQLVTQAQFRVSTGFAGTAFVLDALARSNQFDAAYRLLLEQQCPSWMYPVTMGATTVWERWDSMLPDGSINTGEMTSFNHYALGAVADWIHRFIGGIAPLEPGYRQVLIAPRPGGGLTHAASSLRTPHGLVSLTWKVNAHNRTEIDIELPAAVTGVLSWPGQPDQLLTSGRTVVSFESDPDSATVVLDLPAP